MRALTLTQPWATLVATGAKRIETRSWGNAYTGPLAIHAAKGLAPVGGAAGLARLCADEPFREALDDANVIPANLPRGVIVAVARLDRCVPMTMRGVAEIEHGHPREHAFGHYEAGRYAWVLRDVARLAEPVECRGALGLWTVPRDVERRVTAQLQALDGVFV